MATSKQLVELIAQNGLSPRQSKRLTLEALLAGTLYEGALEYDWHEQTDALGHYRKAALRRPLVQSGLGAEKFQALMDYLVAERVFPTIEAEDASDETQEELQELLEDLSIRRATRSLCRGMLLGSGVMGFHEVDVVELDGTARTRLEDAELDATWCEPIFASQVGTEAAQAIAEGLNAAGLGQLVAGDNLKAPRGSDSLDLAFLRYEWKVASEVRKGSGIATDSRETWYRRDYTPDAVVYYKPITRPEFSQRPMGFELDEERQDGPLWQHGWGFVPAVWATPEGTRAGEVEGPSFLSPQLLSVSQGADYLESHTQDATSYGCSPQMVMMDCTDQGAGEAARLNSGSTQHVMPATPQKVIMAKTSGMDGKSGSVTLLETKGEATRAAHERLAHLDGKADRISGIMSMDAEDGSGVLSGEALKLRMAPTVARVDRYRADITAPLRLYVKKAAIAQGLDVGKIKVTWPEFIEPTAADYQAYGQAFAGMVTAGVFPRDAAVRELAKMMGRDDADELATALLKEEEEKLQQAMDMAAQRLQGSDEGGEDE